MRAVEIFAGVGLLCALGLGAGCRAKMVHAAEDDAAAPRPPAWVDTSPHLSATAEVDGVHLNYLDWGGMGSPLVLVHGLGGNPHLFDDLAPLLREHHHVIAYASRGHGDSDAPPRGPYDLRALVGDLGGLLDQLRIERTSLLAWSTGGREVTRFAALAPERVEKLVYLDAGYDWSDPAFLAGFRKIVAADGAGDGDVETIDAYRAWFQDVWLGAEPWTSGLEAYLRGRVAIHDDGHLEPRMPGAVAAQLFAALARDPPDYARVTAPALALYATSFFPVDAGSPARLERARDFERRIGTPFRQASMDHLTRDLRGVAVRQLEGTTHVSIGVHDVTSLAATIDAFLSGAPPDASAPPPL